MNLKIDAHSENGNSKTRSGNCAERDKHIKVFLMNTAACPRRLLDSTRIANFFRINGAEIVRDAGIADYIIVVTCVTTNSSEDNSFEWIERFSKHPGELIVGGCLPAIGSDEFRRKFQGRCFSTKSIGDIDRLFPSFRVKYTDIPDANWLFNNDNLDMVFKRFLVRFKFSKINLFRKFRIEWLRKIFDVYADPGIIDRKTAYLRISYGCMENCAYCRVKHAVGRLKSKPVEDIVDEYRRLIDGGVRNFLLEGDDTGSYGLDIRLSLADLILSLEEIDRGIPVSWDFGKLNPKWIMRYRKELLGLIEKGRIAELRVGLQSANSRILKLMNRNYDVEAIRDILKEYKTACPGLKMSGTFIVGFPTETDDEFNEFLNYIGLVKFDRVILFAYSDAADLGSYSLPGKVDSRTMDRRISQAIRFLKENGIDYTVHYLNE
ncbi:MAG: radical SAM protein [archaeon]